jgi:hypothetical protein
LNTSLESKGAHLTPLKSIKSVFKSQEAANLMAKSSHEMQRISSRVEAPSIAKQTSLSTNSNSSSNLNSSQQFNKKNRVSIKESKRSINETNENATVAPSINKPDQVLDVLKEAICNDDSLILDKQFVDKVIRAVKMQQLNQKRAKDKAKKVCLCGEIFVIILIIIMTFFFARSVIYQIEIIQTKAYYVKNNQSYPFALNSTSFFSKNKVDFFSSMFKYLSKPKSSNSSLT